MQVSRVKHGDVVVVMLRGPMVADELDLLDVEVRECFEEGLRKMVLDMKEVPFIDSAGLEKILDILADFGKRGGDLCVASLNEVCQDIFIATQLKGLVQVAANTEVAVRNLS